MLDLLARVDALTARKHAARRQRSRSSPSTSGGGRPSRACARFAAIDTLTALSIHLELGADWHRFEKAHRLGCVARVDPVAEPIRRVLPPGRDHQDRLHARPPAADRSRLALRPATRGSARPSRARQHGQPEHVLAIANRAQHRLHRVYRRMRARGKPHHVDRRRGRPRTRLLPLGRRHRRLTHARHPPRSGGRGAGPIKRPGTRETPMSNTHRCHARLLDPRTPAAHQGLGVAIPAYQTGDAVNEPDAPPSRTHQRPCKTDAIPHAHLTNVTHAAATSSSARCLSAVSSNERCTWLVCDPCIAARSSGARRSR